MHFDKHSEQIKCCGKFPQSLGNSPEETDYYDRRFPNVAKAY